MNIGLVTLVRDYSASIKVITYQQKITLCNKKKEIQSKAERCLVLLLNKISRFQDFIAEA